jgi:hypothetical protein
VVKAIYTGSEFVEVSSSKHDVGIVLESTSFYAEQGGQVLFPPVSKHCAWTNGVTTNTIGMIFSVDL